MSIFNRTIDRLFPPVRKVDAKLYEDCLEHMAKLNARIKELEAEIADRADAEKHLLADVADLTEEVPAGWNLGAKQEGVIVVWRRYRDQDST
jgi:uncharacterized protein YicC (UPF0701 family)